MGIIIRQTIKSSLVTFVASCLAGINIVLIQNYIPKAAFGELNISISICLLISEFVLFLSPIIYIVFIKNYEKSQTIEAGFNKYNFRVPLLLLATFIISSFIYYFFIKDLPYFNKKLGIQFINKNFIHFILMVVSFLLYSATTVILAAKHKNTISSITKDLIPRVYNLAIILLFIFKIISLNTAIILMMYQFFIASISNIVIIAKKNLFPLISNLEPPAEDKKEILKYRLTHMPISILLSLSVQSIALIYLFYYNDHAAAYAVFSVSVFVASFMNIPYDQLSRSALSTLSQVLREGNITKVNDMYQRANLSMLHISSVFAVLILGSIPLLILLSDYKYSELLYITPFFIIAKWIDMSSGFSTEVIMSSKFYKQLVWLALWSFVFMIICYIIFIPLWGAVGIALSNLLWFLFFNILKINLVKKKLGLSPFIKNYYFNSFKFIFPIIILSLSSLYFLSNPWLIFIANVVLGLFIIFIIWKKKLNFDFTQLLSKAKLKTKN